MRARIVLAAFLLLTLATLGAAQTPDFLKAGGWEFGGNFMFSHKPDFPIFASDVSEEDKGGYQQTIDAGASAGLFLADRFSLALHPSAFWYKSRYLNSSLQESYYQALNIGLGVESTYYLTFGPAFALGLGGELGIGALPGLDGVEDDAADPDSSLALNFWLEPKVAAYILTSGNLAPYAVLGCKLVYFRHIKNTDGSSYDYPDGYSLFDDVGARFTVTLGLKYFLPQGGRFAEQQKASFDDLMDEGVLGK
jgi:hypothetical protein